ncbi:MAG: isoamylase early set domain-containing protein [Oscillochloridaceae bacterium umkhey_bin13]
MILQIPIGHREVAVVFRLPAQIWAERINLVGDFNGWSTSATPMRLGEQYWEARLDLPAGGRYYYAYLIDRHEWCTENMPWEHAVGEETRLVTMIPIDIPQAQRSVAGSNKVYAV